MLQIVDAQWKDHLYSLDHLKEGIGLRGYGQRDPLVEYKRESFELFQAMKARIDEEMVRYLWWLRPVSERGGAGRRRAAAAARAAADDAQRAGRAEPQSFAFGGRVGAVAARRRPAARRSPAPKPARTGGDDARQDGAARRAEGRPNDPCPCGSGKKYKKCHGAAA